MSDLLLFVGVAVVVTCALALLVVWLADTDRLRTSLRCEECHAPVTVRDDTDRAAWARCEAAGVVRCTEHAPKPVDPLSRCHNLSCGREWTTYVAHGWLLCDEHAAAIRNRKPYDQERSAS